MKNKVAEAVHAAIQKHVAKCEPRRRLEAELELRIALEVVRGALRAGYSVTVHDGEDIGQDDTGKPVERSRDLVAIVQALFSTDEDRLLIDRPNRRRASFVLLIWGNGADVVSDYSVNLEPIMIGANKLADFYG